MILAALSDAAVEQIAEVVKATSAQQQEPHTYLVLLFSASIILLIVCLMLKYAHSTQERFVKHVETHEAAEDGRIRTMQEMATTCHVQATKHLELAVGVANRCESTMRETNALLQRAVGKQ